MTPSLNNLKPEQRDLLIKAFGNAIPNSVIISATLENQRRALEQRKRNERSFIRFCLMLIVVFVVFALAKCGGVA